MNDVDIKSIKTVVKINLIENQAKPNLVPIESKLSSYSVGHIVHNPIERVDIVADN